MRDTSTLSRSSSTRFLSAAMAAPLLRRGVAEMRAGDAGGTSVRRVVIGVVIAVTIGGIFVCKTRFGLGRVTVAVLLCLVIVSNQFLLVRVIGNGGRDREFKLLADWYVASGSMNFLTRLETQLFIQRCFEKSRKGL